MREVQNPDVLSWGPQKPINYIHRNPKPRGLKKGQNGNSSIFEISTMTHNPFAMPEDGI